jgi:hypothetical protein
MAIGRDKDLLPLANAVFNEHFRRKIGHSRDPLGALANQGEQRSVSLAEGTGIAIRLNEHVRIMNAYDGVFREHRTEISEAQYPGSAKQGQNELVPGMACSETCLANGYLRQSGLYINSRR